MLRLSCRSTVRAHAVSGTLNMNVEAGTRARRRNREHPNRGGLQRQSLRRPHRPSQTGVGRRRAHTDSHPPRTDPPGSNRSLSYQLVTATNCAAAVANCVATARDGCRSTNLRRPNNGRERNRSFHSRPAQRRSILRWRMVATNVAQPISRPCDGSTTPLRAGEEQSGSSGFRVHRSVGRGCRSAAVSAVGSG